MVKIMKHELYAIFRVLIFLAAASLLFAAAGRITYEVSRVESSPLVILFGVFYIALTFLIVFEAWILGVTRFYRTLFTGEGYLTLSLPVSPTKLLFGKLLSAVIAGFAALGVGALSLTILTVGVEDSFVWDVFGELFVSLGNAIADEPVVALEFIVFLVVMEPLTTLIAYAVLSFGQMLSTHRKLVIFALSVGVYVVIQIFLTYCLEPIVTATDAVSGHLTIWLIITLCAAIDAICFFLVRYILTNKVNLL